MFDLVAFLPILSLKASILEKIVTIGWTRNEGEECPNFDYKLYISCKSSAASGDEPPYHVDIDSVEKELKDCEVQDEFEMSIIAHTSDNYGLDIKHSEIRCVYEGNIYCLMNGVYSTCTTIPN